MGTDIRGYVEIRSPWTEAWRSVVEIRPLVGRNRDAFGCLFGVRNTARFAPIAAQRGLPDDLSDEVRTIAEHYQPLEGAFLDSSWISWAELKAIDWDEQALATDLCIHIYRRDARGEWVYDSKSEWQRPPRTVPLPLSEQEAFARAMEEEIANPQGLPEGQEWEADGKLYRSVRLRRADAIDDKWRLVFEMMETLARRYGDTNVRLVVWFDV